LKVAICFPHYGDVKAVFAQSLANMVAYSLNSDVSGPEGRVRLELPIVRASSSILPHARNTLVKMAMETAPEWLLLVDVDHAFPPDSLLRLLIHGKEVVRCNYIRRKGTEPLIEPGEGLEEVQSMGLGFCLVHRSVIERLTGDEPLFWLGIDADGGVVGEDVWFFRKLRAAGIRLFVDHDLSREVGHISEVELRLP
jgi:hypothetical protein